MVTDVQEIGKWLDTKGVTLWGDWDITDPKQRAEAAWWFANQMDDYQQWQRTNRNPHEIKAGAWDVTP